MALIPKRDGPGTQLLESPFGVYPLLRAEEIASTSDCVRGAPTLDAPALAPDIFDNKCFQKENTHTQTLQIWPESLLPTQPKTQKQWPLSAPISMNFLPYT